MQAIFRNVIIILLLTFSLDLKTLDKKQQNYKHLDILIT